MQTKIPAYVRAPFFHEGHRYETGTLYEFTATEWVQLAPNLRTPAEHEKHLADIEAANAPQRLYEQRIAEAKRKADEHIAAAEAKRQAEHDELVRAAEKERLAGMVEVDVLHGFITHDPVHGPRHVLPGRTHISPIDFTKMARRGCVRAVHGHEERLRLSDEQERNDARAALEKLAANGTDAERAAAHRALAAMGGK